MMRRKDKIKPGKPSQIKHLLIGSLGFGIIAFIAGFVGPIIFMPSSNQGPLMGIFITGPIGFVVGGIGGYSLWMYKCRKFK